MVKQMKVGRCPLTVLGILFLFGFPPFQCLCVYTDYMSPATHLCVGLLVSDEVSYMMLPLTLVIVLYLARYNTGTGV